MPPLLAEADVAALPWYYAASIGVAGAGAIAALWKRDMDREKRREERADARDDVIISRLAENTVALKDATEVISAFTK